MPLGLPLGWDELVYASRFGPYGPATEFSAPRSRGVPVLIAPVASWSDSVVLLRVWLNLAAGLALYLGFRPWLRVVRRPVVVPVAAAAYVSLWVVLFYAGEAMPNHYTAMAGLAAVGCFVSPSPSSSSSWSWRTSVLLAGAIATAALMRPNDAVIVAAPLLLGAVFVRRWRRPERIGAVLVGGLLGLLPWVVEAYLRFGGVRERLARAEEIQGGMRPTFTLPEYVGSLDGPLLCRPCSANWSTDPAWQVLGWWLLLLALVVVGMRAARRERQLVAELWLAVAAAGATAGTYLFLVDYAAPRFLLPAYALLVLPAARGALEWWERGSRVARGRRGWRGLRGVLVGVTVGVLVAHLVAQLVVVRAHASIQERARGDWVLIAAVLRAHGVSEPCRVKANTAAIPIGHTAGCHGVRMSTQGRRPDALVLRDREPPDWARDWERVPVPGAYGGRWEVLLPPPSR
ncbi:hypothetical protein [Streptomyces apocyni]|uniref:hypothetical protein n=1 Tax=Streptomyces apocyni TaxID=2654677 RepID=UPI0012EAEC77|nr:hypothetical protein [Streptomyces apocyni]